VKTETLIIYTTETEIENSSKSKRFFKFIVWDVDKETNNRSIRDIIHFHSVDNLLNFIEDNPENFPKNYNFRLNIDDEFTSADLRTIFNK